MYYHIEACQSTGTLIRDNMVPLSLKLLKNPFFTVPTDYFTRVTRLVLECSGRYCIVLGYFMAFPVNAQSEQKCTL